MTIEQKILSKLAPHAKRIKDGDGNDFDYLPAVLLQVLEEQKRQSQTLDDVKKSLAAMDNKADGLARKLHQLRWLILGFAASLLIIGLAVTILQGH